MRKEGRMYIIELMLEAFGVKRFPGISVRAGRDAANTAESYGKMFKDEHVAVLIDASDECHVVTNVEQIFTIHLTWDMVACFSIPQTLWDKLKGKIKQMGKLHEVGSLPDDMPMDTVVTVLDGDGTIVAEWAKIVGMALYYDQSIVVAVGRDHTRYRSCDFTFQIPETSSAGE